MSTVDFMSYKLCLLSLGVTEKQNFTFKHTSYHCLTADKYFEMLCMQESDFIKIVAYSLASFLSLLFSFVFSVFCAFVDF